MIVAIHNDAEGRLVEKVEETEAEFNAMPKRPMATVRQVSRGEVFWQYRGKQRRPANGQRFATRFQ